MCVEIYKVLTRENIEIPYPQSTVHLRGFDAGALDVLLGQAQPAAAQPTGDRETCRTAYFGYFSTLTLASLISLPKRS